MMNQMIMRWAVVIVAWVASPLWAKQPVVGSRAIDFTLPTFDGRRVTLSQLRGKVVLLDFWASWCVPCRKELPYLEQMMKTYGKGDFLVVAVNIDNELANARKFLTDYGIELMSLRDAKKKVVSAYDIATMPSTFLIDKRGRVRFIHKGFAVEQIKDYKQQIRQLLLEDLKPPRRHGKRSS